MSHLQFHHFCGLYWDLRGLIFETIIWLLAVGLKGCFAAVVMVCIICWTMKSSHIYWHQACLSIRQFFSICTSIIYGVLFPAVAYWKTCSSRLVPIPVPLYSSAGQPNDATTARCHVAATVHHFQLYRAGGSGWTRGLPGRACGASSWLRYSLRLYRWFVQSFDVHWRSRIFARHPHSLSHNCYGA